MTLDLETLASFLIVDDDYEIRRYAKRELVNAYGEEVTDLIKEALEEKNEDKYMALCNAIVNAKGLEEEQAADVICVINDIRRKKVMRIPIKGIMKMYHSGNEFLEKKSRQYIVRNYSKYVFELIHKNYPTYADKYGDEMYQSGVVGLLKAMKGYDPEVAEFTTYSKFFVIHEIAQQVNFHNNSSTSYFNNIQKQIRDAIEQIKANGYEPTITRISIQASLKPDIVQRELEYLDKTRFKYLDADEEREQSCEYEDTPEHLISKKAGMERLFESIERLAEKDPNYRDVILLKYEGLRTNDEIAKMLGITVGQVKTYFNRGIIMLRKDDRLASYYGEYISDAERDMQKYSVPKFEPIEETKKKAETIDSFINFPATFGDETTSESVVMC